jgi:arylsulfatase A-like enzyme/Flp pilus assembly protein TadD
MRVARRISGTIDRVVRSRAGLVFAVMATLGSAACSRVADRGLAGPGALRGANVLLVTIDTLRQDRVGAYGNRYGLTPTLDRLAAGGVRYAQAFSPAPLTLPAHASILTGLLPRRHGIHSNARFRLDEHVPTLASVLKGAGYRTGAFVGAFVLDGRFGLNQGFDEYNDRLPRSDRASFHFAERRAAEVVAVAGDWILSGGSGPGTGSLASPQPPAPSPQSSSPWFAWVHLFDPHAPYDAPAEYRTGRASYDAEVAYTDAMLGQLLSRLGAAHALDRTLIVLTADHGESLGDHGEMTHGLFAYDSTLAVPLILKAAAFSPAIVQAPVSHTDVMPTILDLLGVVLPGPVDGQSLVRVPAADRPLYFEALDASLTRGWAPLRGIIQGGWKYIELPDAELYDLATDPGELHNRIDRDPHGDLLKRALRLASGPEAAAPRVALETEAAARLRSLGYAAGSSPSKMNAGDDPKRLVALNERFNSALTTFDEGRPHEALPAFLAILRERPDFVAARASASTVLVATGRSREAVDLLRAGLKEQPDSPELLAKLGAALGAAGDLAGSREALERARRAGNEDPDVLNQLAILLAAGGRTDEARTIFRALIDRNPGAATSWFNLGLFELQNRRGDEAAVALRRATAIDPSYGDAWNALGAALVQADARAASDAWRRAERLLPGDYDLLFNLAMVLAESDTPAEAIPYLQRFAREAPRDRYANDVARAQATLDRLGRRGR